MIFKLAVAFCVLATLFSGIYAQMRYTNVTLPTILSNNKSVEVEATGKTVVVMQRSYDTSGPTPTINCSFSSSNVAVQYSWSWENGTNLAFSDGGLEEPERVPETGTYDRNVTYSVLRFNNFATKAGDYVGTYKCKIGNEQGTPNVYSAPVVKMSDKDYRSVMEGDVLTQTCSIVAYPEPVITWKKNGDPLVLENGRIDLSNGNRTMTIKELQKDDAGVYICSAENELGIGEAYIRLRVKDRLAALWPFLGIVAEVIILVTIILLYEKKRAAQKRNQESQDTAEVKDDRNANDGDVRHRPVKA